MDRSISARRSTRRSRAERRRSARISSWRIRSASGIARRSLDGGGLGGEALFGGGDLGRGPGRKRRALLVRQQRHVDRQPTLGRLERGLPSGTLRGQLAQRLVLRSFRPSSRARAVRASARRASIAARLSSMTARSGKVSSPAATSAA